jgi:hypothetical protein
MKATSIVLTDTDRATLRGWMNAHSGEQRLAFRARIIVLGQSNVEFPLKPW